MNLLPHRSPCTCALIFHPLAAERDELEVMKAHADIDASIHPDPDVRTKAAVQAAVLYAVLFSECVTAPQLNEPIAAVLHAQAERRARKLAAAERAS